MIEVTVEPSDPVASRGPRDAPGRGAYATALGGLVVDVARSSGAEALEVADLYVGEPLDPRWEWVRNGSVLSAVEAAELVVRMCSGVGPFCALVAPTLNVECSWDCVVVLTADVSIAPAHDEPALRVRRREVAPAGHGEEDADVVTLAADEGFWSAVAESTAELKLLRERWAFGTHGSR